MVHVQHPSGSSRFASASNPGPGGGPVSRAGYPRLPGLASRAYRQIETEFDFAPPSLEEKQKMAQRTLLGYRNLSAKVLRALLAARLRVLLAQKGFEGAADPARVNECLDDLLWQRPKLLRDAYKRAQAAKAVILSKEELPPTIESDTVLSTAKLNVYRCFPVMNGWERAFAELLDVDDTGTVLWWHRKEPHKPWSINVLMDNGDGFFPDFIIGIRQRPTEDNGLLADPKEAYSRTKELPKLAAEHASYGKVLILTKDNERERWEIATWDADGEKPVIAGPFRIADAADY